MDSTRENDYAIDPVLTSKCTMIETKSNGFIQAPPLSLDSLKNGIIYQMFKEIS